MSAEIEPGYYHFRATGIRADGEMIVTQSYAKRVSDADDMRKQKVEFIVYCREQCGILEPQITHTVREDKDYENYAEWYDL